MILIENDNNDSDNDKYDPFVNSPYYANTSGGPGSHVTFSYLIFQPSEMITNPPLMRFARMHRLNAQATGLDARASN